ncbi:MAG: cation-translocating P-type ATPase [Clostridiales bacterium]|nr:cation-translocating P-type ATPase [Clostridiales bacterium]
MEQYQSEVSEVLEKVQSSPRGLTATEADRRLAQNGKNALKEQKKHSLIGLFFAQFKDLMSIILIAAAFLSGILAFLTGDKSELADTGILLFIILLNAIVGFLQQFRADSAIDKLKTLSKATAKVVRDGKVIVVEAEDLVLGDIIELEEGARVPADCRILTSENLRVDESALTGESTPAKKRDCVVKKTALADRENTLHMSTFVMRGRARCVVVATGMDTEMGKIAGLLSNAKPVPSPLDKTVSRLGKIITVTVLSVAAVLFIGGLLSRRVSFLHNLMSAVAVAVAAIPEGMGAVVTIILAMGVQRMAKAKAVVRKLSSVETLGSCTCICSDKTGTLTENRMTVEEIRTDFSLNGEEKYTGTDAQRALLKCMRICHTVKGSEGAYVGDPTEVSLVEYADRYHVSCDFKVRGGIAFSSERKMMSVAAEDGGKMRLYVKGAADVLLKKCTLTGKEREKINAQVAALSARAMRVLAFAEGSFNGTVKEEGLTFLGLAAMLDPPKAGAAEAVARLKDAGIRTVMITGDGADTAFAIAARLGIASHREEVITGEELDQMSEEEYTARAQEYSVYARVSPKHKSEIVKALQARGEVVAMTGDGVNDAPSIKAADIGVAMGSGTDVTKNAADMVLANNDFSAMVTAVEEGRNVFYSIKKTISFFLSTNLAEVLAVLFATLVLWKFEFLTSTQLLWINLITDSLPVLALGVERTDDVMTRPPVRADDIFSRRSVCDMVVFALVQTSLVFGLFVYAAPHWGNGAASTAAFLLMSLVELFHAFNVRRERSALGLKGLVSNRALLITAFVGVALNVMLPLVPVFRLMFSLTALSGGQWAIVLALAVSIVPFGELYKAIMRGFTGKLNRRRRYSFARESIR